MSELDIKSIQNEIARNFEEMKGYVVTSVKKEAQGIVDSELKAKIDVVNNSITELHEKMEKAEKALAKEKARRTVGEALECDGELKDAWIGYIRRGAERLSHEQRNLMETHTKALNSASDPSGGYLVIPFFDSEVTRRLYETSPMRQIATVKTISTDQYEKPTQLDLAGAYWQDRDADYVDTATQTWGRLTIRVHKLVSDPKVSQDLLDDAYVDIESELLDSIATSMDILENLSFVSGSGVGQPRGFLTYPSGTTWGSIEQIPTGEAAAITVDSLTDLTYSLKSGYRTNARFVVGNSTLAAVRKIVDGNGNALWTPQFGSEPSTIMGYPVTVFADMPAVEAGALPIAFGDFRRGYIVVDRAGTRVLRDPYTNSPHVRFAVTRRVGGGVNNFEAIKLLKVAAS